MPPLPLSPLPHPVSFPRLRRAPRRALCSTSASPLGMAPPQPPPYPLLYQRRSGATLFLMPPLPFNSKVCLPFLFRQPPFGTVPSSPPGATPPWHGAAVRHSYLDALLSPSSHYLYPSLPLRRRSRSLPPISNQCFWCLSTNHLVADCRRPSVLALASSWTGLARGDYQSPLTDHRS